MPFPGMSLEMAAQHHLGTSLPEPAVGRRVLEVTPRDTSFHRYSWEERDTEDRAAMSEVIGWSSPDWRAVVVGRSERDPSSRSCAFPVATVPDGGIVIAFFVGQFPIFGTLSAEDGMQA